MKILHTSDWHLGKRLEHFSRFDEQVQVMNEIIAVAGDEDVDVVIVAGDVFDVYNPSVEAVELFYRTLKSLSNEGKRPVIVIAGNHDSPDRIEAPDVLARINGILFSGYPGTQIEKTVIDGGFAIINTEPGFIEIETVSGELLRVILMPFANEQRLRKAVEKGNNTGIAEYLEGIWQALSKKYCDKQGVNILLSHMLFSGEEQGNVEEPEDEKPIEHISEKILTGRIPVEIDYVALGHLHRYQSVQGAQCPVVYSGSPLAYSFSEANQTKYVIVADAKAGEKLEYKTVPLQKGKRLYKKRFPSLDDAKQWLTENQGCLVECTIKNDLFFKPSELKMLHEIHDGIVGIIPDVVLKQEGEIKEEVDISKTREELFREYFKEKHGTEINDELMQLFKEVIAE